MKKILITILSVIIITTLTGCGSKKQSKSSDSNTTTTTSTTTTTRVINNDDDIIIDDDEIIDFDDEDNSPSNEGTVTVSEVINCEGCVFAYFDAEGDKAKRIGSTLSSSEYTTDINDLKTAGKKQRHNFFGLVLSGNTISKAYACILKDSKIYCIQGSTNGAYHESNIAILNKIFTSDQCRTISAGHTYTCTDGHYNGDTQTTGLTSLHYETSCVIYGSSANTGKLICH